MMAEKISLSLIPQNDLKYIFDSIPVENWHRLCEKNIFISGATGFIGQWLLASLNYANDQLNLNTSVSIITRRRLLARHLFSKFDDKLHLEILNGDVREEIKTNKKFAFIIHAATDVENPLDPYSTLDVCIRGTKNMMELAKKSGVKDFLLTSSGAVYGSHDLSEDGFVEETPFPRLNHLKRSAAYAEGKRLSEWLLMNQASTSYNCKVARIYAQVGPLLPLDKHFAIGNLLLDAFLGRDLVIRGDGQNVRSYLYVADTIVWLWKILFTETKKDIFNVGGDEAVSILQLAHRIINNLNLDLNVVVQGEKIYSNSQDYYVSNNKKAKLSLGISEVISLDLAIKKTFCWMKKEIKFD